MSSKGSKFGKSILKMFDTITNDKKSNATSQANAAAADLEASQESMRTNENLQLCKMVRHGFPYKPTCIAYDIVQHMVAIGTRNGYVRLFGADGVESTMFHVSSLMTLGNTPSAVNTNLISGSPICGAANNGGGFSPSVLFMSFLMNEGALITYCDDNTLSFWNIRQKQPGMVFTKKLVNERVSAMHLPFQSNWIYIGTEKGNTYVLNVYNNFSQSGYDIKWNNVIELSQKTKPGKVIHLSDHPQDSSKLLIGFDSGLIVLWNVKIKRGELRFYGTSETMSSISWFFDGKQFMSAHNNGSLIVWNCKPDTKPVTILHPHMSENDLIPQYNMIRKVHWNARQNGEQLIIFSDGLPSSGCAMRDAITIIRNNKIKTIIEMKDKIVDFIVINISPWISENPPDPIAVIVLLETNFVVIDLKTEGYPLFDHHHPINIHESPVSICQYMVEPSLSIYRNLNELKEKHASLKQTTQKNTGMVAGATTSIPFYSQLPYPINGGIKCPKPNIFPYNELIVTGHEDGSVKLWDSSGISLKLLNKFKTHKLFDKRQRSNNDMVLDIDTPFKIVAMNACNNYIAVAGLGGHVTLYKFHSRDFSDNELGDISLLEIPYNNEETHETSPSNSDNQQNSKVVNSYLRTKVGFRRQAGYQPELVCLFSCHQRPPVINNVLIYTKNNLILIGTDESIVCVDYSTRSILINVSVTDIYSGQKSPKKNAGKSNPNEEENSLSGDNFITRQFTLDGTSRSSSSSSLENISLSEGVSFIAINENSSSAKNPDSGSKFNQIWLGTNHGSVFVLNSFGTYCGETQQNGEVESIPKNESYMITPAGVHIKLKGQIMDIAFLDMNGILLTPVNSNNNQSTSHKSSTKIIEAEFEDLDIDFDYGAGMISNSIADNFFGGPSGGSVSSSNSQAHETTSGSSSSPNTTPTANSFVNPFANQQSQDDNKDSRNKPSKKSFSSLRHKLDVVNDMADRNLFAVITSEHQIKVVALPNLVTVHKYTITEGTVAKASVVVLNTLSYLSCCLTNGTFLVFNLPNLKLNMQLSLSPISHDKNFVDRISKTFTFGSKGHAFYMSSAFEMQKLFISSSSNNFNLSDMLSELFDPKIVTPPVPKTNIFKTIFSNANQAQLDREELFGDASGKPSVPIVKNVESEVNRARGEMSELQKLALERGEKLSALQMKSEALTEAASAYAKNAQALAAKYKKKSEWF